MKCQSYVDLKINAKEKKINLFVFGLNFPTNFVKCYPASINNFIF